MNDAKQDLKKDIENSVNDLRKLRDEIRLKIHLAGMDVKSEWQKLEPEILEAERSARVLTDATRASLTKTVKRLVRLSETL